MQNTLWRKGIVIGIIVLFIGASFFPNISGNIRKSNNVKEVEDYYSILANDTSRNGNTSDTFSFIQDITPPEWRNQGQDKTNLVPWEIISLSAQGRDNIALDWSWVATNETGEWQNFTGSWWNHSWEFFKELHISNSNPDYQMLITVYREDGHDDINNGTVDCEDHCNFNLSDICFVDQDNITLLPYWIEETGIDNGDHYARIWVKTPSDIEIDEKILMYYGNGNVPSISNGYDTFPAMFEDMSYDCDDKWYYTFVDGGQSSKTFYHLYPLGEELTSARFRYKAKLHNMLICHPAGDRCNGITDENGSSATLGNHTCWYSSWDGWSGGATADQPATQFYTSDGANTENTTRKARTTQGNTYIYEQKFNDNIAKIDIWTTGGTSVYTDTLSDYPPNKVTHQFFKIFQYKCADSSEQLKWYTGSPNYLRQYSVGDWFGCWGWIDMRYYWMFVAKYANIEPIWSAFGNEQPHYSVYGSPMKMQENDQWQWSNFTWQNPEIAVGTQVGWRIYYNDTSGNVNCTDIMSFTVIADTIFPEISNVQATPSTQEAGGYVSITCDVTDNGLVDTVKVNITGPTGFIPLNVSMNKVSMNKESYYYNTTYKINGTYYYFIWANDASGNGNMSDIYHFEILADSEPPEITDVTLTHSNPKDTIIGWENFSCTVTDITWVDTVQLNITWPDMHTEYHIMNKVGDTYYYNTTLTDPGGIYTPGYTYNIYATDTSGNHNTSASEVFKLPSNLDVNEDGSVGFVDYMTIAGQFYGRGPPGWTRSDVDNNGRINELDFAGNPYFCHPACCSNFAGITDDWLFDHNLSDGENTMTDSGKSISAHFTNPINIIYSTYLGGNSWDYVEDIAVDDNGCFYVTGFTISHDFPMVNAYDPTYSGCIDIFVTKFSSSGEIIYSTYFGGVYSQFGHSITVDNDGCAYITGTTTSGNFPTTPDAYQKNLLGISDAFIVKFSPTGDLLYSTYLGGSKYEEGYGIKVDNNHNIYVAGSTNSPDFPITCDPYNSTYTGHYDAFVVKLSDDGQNLIYSVHFGGTHTDYAHGIDVDDDGATYVAGGTWSSDFPIVDGYDTSFNGECDGFLAKLSADGHSFQYSTYFGGSKYDNTIGMDVAVDSEKNVYIGGHTKSPDLPIVNAFDDTLNDGIRTDWDGFIAKFSSNCSLVYSTYLGGSDDDEMFDITVDNDGCAYVTGYTASNDFPIANASQEYLNGGSDVFVTKLIPSGYSLSYSTYLGGSNSESGCFYPSSIAVDTYDCTYVAGSTWSSDFPITDNAYDPAYNDECDGFITKIIPMNIMPPEITNVTITTSDPLDTEPGFGWENFTCTVIGESITEVKLVLIGDTTTEYSMNKDGYNYYCNITITTADEYTYYIQANNIGGNYSTSTPQPFDLPMNEDVNEDGSVGFVDIMSVAGQWMETGHQGWIREDVNNDGEVGFVDIMMVAGMWGQEW